MTFRPGLPSRVRSALRRLGLGGAMLLVASPAFSAAVEDRLSACLACHGPQGQSVRQDTPSLGGQPPFFLVAQLFLFREGRRNNVEMIEAARDLGTLDLRALGERISMLPPPAPPGSGANAERSARGRAIAQKRQCPVCHLPDFTGREAVPRLANQREDYLFKTMRDYRGGTRVGYGGTMTVELTGLTDAELGDLAHYLSHLPVGTR